MGVGREMDDGMEVVVVDEVEDEVEMGDMGV